MRCNVFQRSIGVLLLAALMAAGLVSPAMTQAQDATPTAIAGLPEGPLGEQIQWLVDYINLPEADAANVDLTTKFGPGVLADVSADQLQQILNNIRTQLAPVTVDTETMVTTENLPPTNANFYLVGPDGTQLPATMSVDAASGLITSIWFAAPIAPAATTVPTETATPTATVAPTETATLAPTETATLEPSATATLAPTETPTQEPTQTATSTPTETATSTPTETATLVPTETATLIPTETETLVPTETETLVPTETPTLVPTETPTLVPTETETLVPTETETLVPTETATLVPTETETLVPTETETLVPTETATTMPTETEEPTEIATMTEAPTETPSATATEPVAPAASPMASPMASPPATEEVSTVASPVAPPISSDFPAGPLGEQAAWTWSTLSNDGEIVHVSEIEAHLSPELLSQVSAPQVSATLVQLQQQYGPFTLDPDSMIVSANEPPTNLSYRITGKDDMAFQVAVSIDPGTGLLTGFAISPATSSATPAAAVAIPSGMTDTEVSFTSGDDTLYGSFLAPDGMTATDSRPAALIISGSGPTDRNGNSGNLSMNTNLNLAITLAQEGIPSLRYDKLGSGQTGLASHTDVTTIDYELFLQEARDAAKFLAEQPGVDPSKLIIVGHSEGALFALVLAKELTDAGTPPAALILAAPLSVRYLDILNEQLTGQAKAAVAAGTITQEAADAATTELQAIIESLRTDGTLPVTITTPELTQIFNPGTTAFLAQIDKIDPAEVAASLPDDLPVLVLLGYKDAQVTGNQVRHLMGGFRDAGNGNVHLASLPLADHTLRIVEGDANPSVDYANPDLEFSPEAVRAIDDFLTEYGLAQAG